MDVRHALALYLELAGLVRGWPQHVQTLLALARGQTEGLNPKCVADLREDGLVTEDSLSLPDDVRDVLFSSYREATPDGPAMVYPFRLASEQDKLIVERVERQMDRNRRRWLRGDDLGGGPSLP
jgi:hypothetical protein